MLQPRYFIVTIMSVAIFAIVILLVAAGYLPLGTVDKTVSPIDDRDPMLDRVELSVDAGASVPAVTGPAASHAATQDGRSLLDSYCTQCHTARSFEGIEKSRSDWENTLAQMEALGVHLEEAEKVILLDYLAGDARP